MTIHDRIIPIYRQHFEPQNHMKYFFKISLILLFVTTFFFLIYKITIPRIAAFGCFDDCFNFGAGYFLTKGKHLYSEIFFNHQPLPAFVSAGIQLITTPENIYELLLRHRQFILLISLAFDILLIFRFGFIGAMFMVLYEVTKFYIFGDRFLAEGIIVYPFIFIVGTLWDKFQNKALIFDNICIVGCTVFIFFMREPYIPAALFLFVIALIKEPLKKKIIYFFLLCILITVPFLFFSIPDYIFNLFTVNRQYLLPQTLSGSNFGGLGIIQIFFYPITIFFDGHWTIFRYILLSIDGIFLITSGFYLRDKKNRLFFLGIILTLGLLNLRIVPPGQMFFESFHLLPWYGVFMFITLLLIRKLHQDRKLLGLAALTGFILIIIFAVVSPQAFFHENIDSHIEFTTNYSEEIKIGNALHELSNPTDTIFIDGWAELIYWQANRVSPYRYIWYTSVMPLVPRYSQSREEMFIKNPPDFYYGTCPHEKNKPRIMPEHAQPFYTNISSEGQSSCLWIKTEKIPSITDTQWAKAKELLFDKP